MTFPHSAVLFLRHHTSTPGQMRTRIVTPGGTVEYNIQVMKMQQYTLEEIFEKNLLLLLPFYIFSHETRFGEYEKDKTKLKTLQDEYEQIKNKLEALLDQGAISEYTRCTIIDMSNKVLEHIAIKYRSVREGVKAVMGGKVLEYEAKTIRREGIKEGREEERGNGIKILILDNIEEQIPKERILLKLQNRYSLTKQEAEKYYKAATAGKGNENPLPI